MPPEGKYDIKRYISNSLSIQEGNPKNGLEGKESSPDGKRCSEVEHPNVYSKASPDSPTDRPIDRPIDPPIQPKKSCEVHIIVDKTRFSAMNSVLMIFGRWGNPSTRKIDPLTNTGLGVMSTDIVLSIENHPPLRGPPNANDRLDTLALKGTRQAVPLLGSDLSNILDAPICRPVDGGKDVNDSLFNEGYSPPPATFAGRQRKGAHQSTIDIKPIGDHSTPAGRLLSQLPEPTPLPAGVRRSIDFIDLRSDTEILSYCGSRLSRIKEISTTTRFESYIWYRGSPKSISPATGEIDLAFLAIFYAIPSWVLRNGLPNLRTVSRFWAVYRMPTFTHLPRGGIKHPYVPKFRPIHRVIDFARGRVFRREKRYRCGQRLWNRWV